VTNDPGQTHVVARRNARGGRSAQEHLVAALRLADPLGRGGHYVDRPPTAASLPTARTAPTASPWFEMAVAPTATGSIAGAARRLCGSPIVLNDLTGTHMRPADLNSTTKVSGDVAEIRNSARFSQLPGRARQHPGARFPTPPETDLAQDHGPRFGACTGLLGYT
jgi:hypothetical protein